MINIDLNLPVDYDETIPEGDENESGTMVRSKTKNLSIDDRRAIYIALLKKSVNGKLKWGTTKAVANEFSVTMRTVQRIWKRAKETSNGVVNVSHLKTKNCGRKRVQIDLQQLKSIPLSKRTTLRSTAYAIKVAKLTLFRCLKRGGKIRRHSNSIKPFLTDKNKRSRVEFCLSMLDKNSFPNNPQFVNMENIIHIDEKWFYLTKKSENYYLVVDEEEPHRTCKSKNFVVKVMFFAAVARPRYDAGGNEIFSGKIGIYPFVTKEPAKRSSVNRVAGTLETKVITSIGRDVIRSYLIEKVLPDIRAKWPDGNNITVYIQQDNARTHLDPTDREFCEVVSRFGFDIRLMCQPSNSPDLNILDLGFFNAIQSLRYKECPKTIDELITPVERSFQAYPPRTLNKIFCTLQRCMMEILRVQGSNKYKIPHMKKSILERQGRLSRQMKCDVQLVTNAISWLNLGS
ncbi:uncharacterized protein LOC141691797 [Apium graveolens]|uniref:uncharacterized protein LOC141691797 n=1 Tax=Apium graveolens TaxID=4045 RepID=UPI003D78FC29